MANRLIQSTQGPAASLAGSVRRLRLSAAGAAALSLATALLLYSFLAFDTEGHVPWRIWAIGTLFGVGSYLGPFAVLVVTAVVLVALIRLRRALQADLRTLRPVLRQRLRRTR